MPDNFLKKIVASIDLTSLNDSDTETVISALCEKAVTPLGNVAAVCVYPQFIKIASKKLHGKNINIASVANFQTGDENLQTVLDSIYAAIHEGANEIDVVFPYKKFLKGDKPFARDFISECKKVCGHDVLLKVILETGAFPNLELIKEASRDVLMAGADFLKTSTGKIAIGATLDAAEVMLTTIKELTPALNRTLGFKASGGVRTIEQAKAYIELAETIMGAGSVTPNTFRIGASQLLDEIMKH